MSSTVIDADGHIVETYNRLRIFGRVEGAQPSMSKLLERETRKDWQTGIHPEVTAGGFDPSDRVKDMDREGIDVAINFPTAMLGASDMEKPQDSVDACQAYNTWFAETYRKANPDRFKFVGVLPMQDVEAAVAEAERAVTELGAVGFYVPPYSKQRHLDDPVYNPLYTKIQKLNVPIGVHGSRATVEPLVARTWFRSQMRAAVLTHPYQQMAAMADVICGGVLERFPKLRVAFLEAGIGWMPSFIARMDEDYERMPDAEPLLTRKPSEYAFSGNVYFSCDPDEELIAMATNALGEDHVLYASDYPHWDSRFPDTVNLIRSRSDLSDSAKKKILGGNARRFYGL